MTGLKLEDPFEQGPGTGNVAQREIKVERLLVDLSRNIGVLEQGFDLGGESKEVTALVDVEGLDPQPVARQQEPLLAPVPDGKGKHSTQGCHALVPERVLKIWPRATRSFARSA